MPASQGGPGGKSLDPTPLMQLSTAYWDSQTFLTANRIGLFETLGNGPMTVESIAAALGTKVRPTRLLVNACVALGLVEAGPEGFRNSQLSQIFLTPDSEAYLGNAIRYSDNLYRAWGELERSLREGVPTVALDSYLGQDPEMTRHFVYGMHNRALAIGRAMVGLVDLSGRKQLLDVGGGPGTFSALLTARYPGLRARVLDLPEVAVIAREILISMQADERVDVIPGDYHSTRFPDANDVVLISGVFHRETKDACRGMIVRARDSLDPGGLLVVCDVFTDAGGTGPLFAALFGLNMMLSAADGGVHADADVAGWMSEAGLQSVEIRPCPPPMPHRLVVAEKQP